MKNINQALVMNSHDINGKKFVSIPTSCLKIDYEYQRPLRSKVKKMVQNWDYELCDAILVSFRDGNFYVVDGQHRVEAAKRRNVDSLACQVLENLTQKDEARRFVAQNTSVSILSPYDTFNANLLLGDPVDTTIKSICDKWEITIGTPHTKSTKRLGNLDEARKIVSLLGSAAFEWILKVLHSAQWNLIPGGHNGDILRALKAVYKEHADFNAAVLVLKNKTPRGVAAQAQAKYKEYGRSAAVVKFMLDEVKKASASNANSAFVA